MPALTLKLGLYQEAHECYRIFQTWTSYVCTQPGYLGLKLKPVVVPGQRGYAGREGMLTGKGQAFGANAWNFSTCRRDRESAKLFLCQGCELLGRGCCDADKRVLVFSSSS